MELSEAMAQNLFGFASALLGGIVGGIFTLYATDKVIREENEKEDRQEEKEIQNLLDAIGVEINALWGFHMRRIGQRVEDLPAGKPLEIYHPLTQDYFTVYNSNASRLGSIKDVGLCEAIVVCYNKCKKVVDGFKYNNDLLRSYREAMAAEHSSMSARFDELSAYAAIIKEDHFELKAYIEHLLQLLAQRDRNN